MKVWFVDDQASNREHWRKSFPQDIADLSLRTFADVASILAAIRIETPDILFVDYFLDERTGLEVVDFCRRRAKTNPCPVLIAHSSLRSASERMVEKGADFAVPKEKVGGVIPAIVAAIRTGSDLESIARTRRWPVESTRPRPG